MFLAIEATLLGLWRALKNPRCVFFLYLPNLALAACVAVPLYAIFNDRLAASPAARDAFAAHDDALVRDFFRIHAADLDAFALTATVAAILWFLCWLFIQGGTLAVLAEPSRRLTATGFFAACGRNFFAFVRGLIPAAIATLLLVLLNDETSRLLLWYFDDLRGGAASEAELGWILTGKTAFFLAAFVVLVTTPTAFARVRAVVDDDRSMVKGYFAGLALCLRRPFATLLLFAIDAALFLAVLVASDEFARRVPLDRDLRPFARWTTEGTAWFDVAIPPVGLHITVWQVALWFAMTLLVARCAALVAFWRATTSPPRTRDPELVYARGPVVDAPVSRGPRAGYAFADDESVRR